MLARRRFVWIAGAIALAGCQNGSQPGRLAYVPSADVTIAAPAPGTSITARRSACTVRGHSGALAGRTLTVRSISDIRLGPREVVLTFDDGPRPGTTPRILKALDDAGVRATFFPVGNMARAYPALLREVARRGHTVGSHTSRHPSLRRLSHAAALEEIARGERQVAKALSGSGVGAAPFFRFPYLADTAALRRALARRGTVVIDVDVDSRDYLRTSSAAVAARTMAQLERRGRGVILFHDIHARTAAMLPSFLVRLRREGFQVVHLVPHGAVAGCRVPGS